MAGLLLSEIEDSVLNSSHDTNVMVPTMSVLITTSIHSVKCQELIFYRELGGRKNGRLWVAHS